jgi:pimeloyl-ACP methyl ester carboxylesterase
MRSVRFASTVLVALVLGGCVDLTHQPAVTLTPASTGNPAALRREGNVYFLRGWLGVWSRGLDVLARRATSELGVSAVSLGQPEWNKLANFIRAERLAGRRPGPLVLAGHSMGGDDQIRIAQLLARDGIKVDLLILIDPNAPPTIPPNVKRCVNFYKSQPGRDVVPIFRGVPVRAVDPVRTRVTNIDLRTSGASEDAQPISHFNISATTTVQEMVLAEIARTCPPKKRS